MAAAKKAAAASAEEKDLALGRFKNSLSIGILGLPNVGKSTLFNLLTKSEVLAANYPFATKEPNKDTSPTMPPGALDRRFLSNSNFTDSSCVW